MSRKNYLNKETFIAVSQQQAKDAVMSIPSFVTNIRLVSENRIMESVRFSYEDPQVNEVYLIDIKVLPLNDQYIRISLHGTYTNGQIFSDDRNMAIALHDFESAIDAAVKGDVSAYCPRQPKVNTSRKLAQMVSSAAASVGVLLMKKKLS